MTLIDPTLLDILRCPRCMGTLSEDVSRSVLVCGEGHEYPVTDGIPDMVID
jgi:uncharacterized protein YbaR (Trm112 family)